MDNTWVPRSMELAHHRRCVLTIAKRMPLNTGRKIPLPNRKTIAEILKSLKRNIITLRLIAEADFVHSRIPDFVHKYKTQYYESGLNIS